MPRVGIRDAGPGDAGGRGDAICVVDAEGGALGGCLVGFAGAHDGCEGITEHGDHALVAGAVIRQALADAGGPEAVGPEAGALTGRRVDADGLCAITIRAIVIDQTTVSGNTADTRVAILTDAI